MRLALTAGIAAVGLPGAGVTAVTTAQVASAASPAPTAYVVNSFSGTVTPIKTATNTAGPAIPVGAEPQGIAITPETHG